MEGFSNEIKTALKDCHIYCLPSYRGASKIHHRSNGYRSRIITTNAPGCDETVIEEYNGFKVPIGNVEMLSRKLGLLIDDKELDVKWVRTPELMFEKEFTLERWLIKPLSLYKKVLKI